MVHEDEVLSFVRSLEDVSEEAIVEKEGQTEKNATLFKREGRIFLVIWDGTNPLRIEVKVDGKLGKLLREKYESVMLSRTLGGSGVEVICSGQLEKDEIIDLIRLSWNYC